ncbi:MAG TPA: hypothetical protein VF881_18960 [Polyangiaceae bacterium]
MTAAVRKAWLTGACCLMAGGFLFAACDVEGITPNCPGEGGDCVTPPGDSAASVVTGGSQDSGNPTDDGGSE